MLALTWNSVRRSSIVSRTDGLRGFGPGFWPQSQFRTLYAVWRVRVVKGRSRKVRQGPALRPRLHAAHPRPRRGDQTQSHRWVVEATHSGLNRNRGILIRWCKKDGNHLALLQLAAGLIAFKKARTARLALAQPG